MGGNVNQSKGKGAGLTGAGRGTDTGTTAVDGAATVDTVERDPAEAGGGLTQASQPQTEWGQTL